MSKKQDMDSKIENQEKIMEWQVHEYTKHDRNKPWYIVSIIVALLLLIYSFFSANFLFAVIIIVAAIVIILNDGQKPNFVNVSLTHEGVILGKKFYDYDEFKNFAIVYKPSQEIKNLYFEFNNVVKPRLSIPLEKINPMDLRNNLLKYLKEDLERKDEPLSEKLGKLFKL